MLPVIRRKRYYRAKSGDLKYKNILNQEFETSKPNEMWCTDITYIFAGEKTLYLSAIKDLYDGSIVAHEISDNQRYELVDRTLKKAKEKVTDGLIFHSDQGCEYTSAEYT